MKPSVKALQLIKNREKCRLTSYKLPGEKYYTIGWGHYCDTSSAINSQWNKAGAKITQSQADALLEQDVKNKTGYIDSYVKIRIDQNLYDALVSTVYQYNPSNKYLQSIFRCINLGFELQQIASMLMSLPSNTYNKKARKADAILAVNGKVVNLETLKV